MEDFLNYIMSQSEQDDIAISGEMPLDTIWVWMNAEMERKHITCRTMQPDYFDSKMQSQNTWDTRNRLIQPHNPWDTDNWQIT